MKIKADKFKGLIGWSEEKGNLVEIDNRVMRKKLPRIEQNKLHPNSICIPCNYSFFESKVDWSSKISAVCHPFRESDIFGNKKIYQFAESDFVDRLWYYDDDKPHNTNYDFVFFTIDSRQGVKCKGTHLLPLLGEVCDEIAMKGVVVDYFNLGNPNKEKEKLGGPVEKFGARHALKKIRKGMYRNNNLRFINRTLGETEMCGIMKQSNFVFFPNTKDASPRMISEGLMRGCPMLINKNIYGGWHYLNEHNGMDFDGGNNYWEVENNRAYYKEELKRALLAMKAKNFDRNKIKEDYYSKYGFYNSAKRIAHIINELNGTDQADLMCYKEFEKIMYQSIIDKHK